MRAWLGQSLQSKLAANSVEVNHRPSRSTERDLADRGRFDTLVRRYLAFVGSHLRRLGVRDAELADASQEVFMTLQAKLSDVASDKEQNFIYGVALRVASHYRRASNRRDAALGQLAQVPESDAATPEQSLADRQMRAVLDLALDELDEHDRQVFVLYELEELSTAEIANLLRAPQGTVKTRLRRARQAFVQFCNQHFAGQGGRQ